VLFTVINSLNKTVLFLAGAETNRYAGLAYAVGGLSVAGIPPVAGFWSKTALLPVFFDADRDATRVLLAGILVVGGLLSLLYMFQSYGRSYWHAQEGPVGRVAVGRTAIVVAGAVVGLALGVWPGPLISLSEAAASVLVRGLP
jgi:multicomponent Na+:H+ antiporter subunit D